MTIREHLNQMQKPYTRWALGFGLLFVLGGAGMLSAANLARSGNFLWCFVTALFYLIGAAGIASSALVPLFRIRCPQCHTAMRARWKRWKYCPFCAAELDRECGCVNAMEKIQGGGRTNESQPMRSGIDATSLTAGTRR